MTLPPRPQQPRPPMPPRPVPEFQHARKNLKSSGTGSRGPPSLPPSYPGTTKSLVVKPSKTAGQNKPEKSWCRRNWCIFVYIVLCFIGLAIPLYIMFLHPCDEHVDLAPIVNYETQVITVTNSTVTQIVTEVKQPVDLQMIMDASGSMSDDDWTNSVLAANEWVKAFHGLIPRLQVGISQFATGASDDFVLGNKTLAMEMLKTLNRREMGGTNFERPLELFEQSFAQNRQKDSLPICVLISDGQPVGNHDAVVKSLKSQGVIMVGIFVSTVTFEDAEKMMFEIASCDGYTRDNCPNYVNANNFQELTQDAQKLASNVASEVKTDFEVQNITSYHNQTAIQSVENISYVEEKSCDVGLWWLMFLLLLPLLLLLLLQCCRGKKKVKVRKMPKKPADIEDPVKPDMPNKPEQGTRKVKKGKYKWDVPSTDHYLWNFSGGVRPLGVDYGDKAPPSAPKDLRLGKVRRKCEAWEEGEEYYEYVEEEQTLEEWAEDFMDKATTSFCCCCCCIKENAKPRPDN